ncbi:hypothetical protein [Undibacterium curvum]|uniref:hypothetical protein n=1 Tax=Undibacterium curvum TaxID=2762294 RepID=UPI003D0BCB22
MKFVKSLILVTLVCCLAACAGFAGINPAELGKTNKQEEIFLTEGVSTVSYRGMNYRWEEGALPGVYKAEREDSKGVYYFGSDRSIWMTNEAFQRKPRLHIGGIFLPHDKSKGPQFFYIFEMDATTIDNIDAYVQSRIVATAASPAVAPGTAGVSPGANVAGNVIGGALVRGLISLNEGRIEMYPPIEDVKAREKILGALRTVTLAAPK